MRQARKRILLGIVAVCAAGALGYWLVHFSGWFGGYESTDDATVFEDGVVVSADMMGRILRIVGDEGDEVEAGEELVYLDRSSLDAQAEQAKAAIDNANCGVGLVEIKLEEAKDDFERAETQFERKIIPQEQYEHQKKSLALARSAVEGAISQRGLAVEQLKIIRTNIRRAVVLSPISGVIAKKWVSVGEVVQPAQPIFTLYDLRSLKVRALFKETQIKHMRKGDAAIVTIDAFPGMEIAGTVETIGVATASQFALLPSDNTSGNYTKVAQRVPVTIVLSPKGSDPAPSGGRIGPGLSAEVRVAARQE
jgi:membrane fusion protein (multidrug efflux system)